MTTPQTPQPTWLTEAQLRAQPVGNVPFDGGTTAPRFLSLPQAGYMAGLDLVTTLNYQFLTVPTQTDVWGRLGGPIQRMRVFVNTEGEMFDCSGFASNLIMAMDDDYNQDDGRNYMYPQASFPPSPQLNSVKSIFFHHIPLALYLKDVPWPIGLYNTAIQNLTIQFQEQFLPVIGTAGTPGTGLYSGGTIQTSPAASGNTDVNEQYFEPIPIAQAQPPLRYIHRWTEFNIPITVGTGLLDLPLPGRQNYIRFIICVVDGATGTTLALNPNILTNLKLTYGVQTSPFDFNLNQLNLRMNQQYGRMMQTWPAGCYFLDFIKDTHTTRDWFNAGNVTNLRLQAALTGAHSGNGGYIKVITEEVLTLAGAGFNNTANYLAAQAAQAA